MKRRILAVFLVLAVCMLISGTDVFAAVNYKWTYDRSSNDSEELIGWGGDKAKFSVDEKVHTENSSFSIKIENTDYNISNIAKTYVVQPYTTYKFSAMVKYSGYQPAPESREKISGACIGKACRVDDAEHNGYSKEISKYSSSIKWTKLEYEFTTGNETAINLCLQNGAYNGECKGTAWFSEVKLERAKLTDKWNILVVIFKNVDATVTVEEKTVTQKASISTDDDDFIRNTTLAPLPQSLKECSGGRMGVDSLDIYTVDETITEKELMKYDIGYRIDENSALISSMLDTYLAKKHYNQIIVIAPIGGEINRTKTITSTGDEEIGDWFGLGGIKYNQSEIAQVNYAKGWFGVDEPFDEIYLHEMAHSLERMSMAINEDKTPDLHDYEKYFHNSITKREYYKIYMSANALPDGKRLDPSVFHVPNGEYTLVSDDMTTGAGIVPGNKKSKPSAPKALRGKSVSDKNIVLDWDEVPGASEYQLVQFKAADHKKIVMSVQFKADLPSATMGQYKKGKTCYFGVRAVKNGRYSNWTYLTFTHTGTKK